jgi:hypothetical protein
MDQPTAIYKFSGLIDTRNARTFEGQRYPNIDLLYGVYPSKQEAFEALSAPNNIGVKALVAGRTVGVKVGDRVMEYWLAEDKAANKYTIDDLVEKGVASIPLNLDAEAQQIYEEIETFGCGCRYFGYRMYVNPENHSDTHPLPERYQLQLSKVENGYNLKYYAEPFEWHILITRTYGNYSKDEQYIVYS